MRNNENINIDGQTIKASLKDMVNADRNSSEAEELVDNAIAEMARKMTEEQSYHIRRLALLMFNDPEGLAREVFTEIQWLLVESGHKYFLHCDCEDYPECCCKDLVEKVNRRIETDDCEHDLVDLLLSALRKSDLPKTTSEYQTEVEVKILEAKRGNIKYIRKDVLLQRFGWSESKIDELLGEPDLDLDACRISTGNASYLLDRVEQAEKGLSDEENNMGEI